MFSIDRIVLHNFKSFRETHYFELPTVPGLYLITGDNKTEPRLGANACGKSTLMEALYWCLYGKTSRGLRAGDVVNWEEKSCSVTVDLTVRGAKFSVHRSQNPNQLALGPVAITQADLEKRLELGTAEVANYSIMHPQFVESFFDLSASEKLSVFSQILDLNYWVECSKETQKLRDELNDQIAAVKQGLARNQGQIELLTADVRHAEGLQQTFVADQKARIATQMAAHAALIKQLGVQRYNQTLTHKALKGFEAKLRLGPTLCSHCGQPMPSEDRQAWQRNLDDFTRQYRREEITIARSEAELEAQAKAIEREKAQINPFAEELKRLNTKLKQCTKEAKKLEADKASLERDHEAVAFWVDGFKRVRLYLVEQALRQLEVAVNNSLISLGLMDWHITMDVERENKSGGVTKGFVVNVQPPASNGTVRWEAFSGGEGQRLRLAGDLGLSNLIMDRAGLSNTVEFFDEPSRHLSQEGLLDLAETLHQRALADGKRIFLCDHNTIDFGNFVERFTVVKDAAGSRLERG